MKKIIFFTVLVSLLTWIFLPGCCKKNSNAKPVIAISTLVLPADDSTLATVTITGTPCPYELHLTNGTLILAGSVPVSDMVIYPSQWINDSITLQIRPSFVSDSNVLFTVKTTTGIVDIVQIKYLAPQPYDNWVFFNYASLRDSTVIPIKANGADTAIIAFNMNVAANASIAPHVYQKNVQFFTNYGNFLTPPGVLAKQAIIPVDFNGNAMVRLIADTIPDTAKIIAVYDNNPNMVKTCDVIFSPVTNTIRLSSDTALGGTIVTITITSSHYFVNKPVVFKSDSGVFLYSATGGTYTTNFDNTGTARAYLKDTANTPSPTYYDRINASFLNSTYQLNDSIYFW